MSRSSSRQAVTRQATGIGVGLAIVLVVPRLARLFYPQVWIEDDFYLENVYLVSVGMRPYLDFLHVHFPVLEWAAGVYVKLFGASLVSLEFLNEAAIYATSLLVFERPPSRRRFYMVSPRSSFATTSMKGNASWRRSWWEQRYWWPTKALR